MQQLASITFFACRQFYGIHQFGIEYSYQPSGKVVQCSGSEGTLLDCMVTNTTTDTTMVIAVFVNCTNSTLHSCSPSSTTESVTRGTP